jgi:tetratricopeptide (TPR) repeat protein
MKGLRPLLAKKWNEHYACHAYYLLHRYAEAIESCTHAISMTENPYAFYWRGLAYRDSGRLDDALRDLAAVAQAEGYFAASAAIEMSMMYFNRHDDRGALDVLNKYTFLYDPNRTGRADVAVSYNNRCYALMQLGELKRALDDCTQSLKYGSIPDAFRKQQELVKRLGTSQTGL